MIRVFTNPLPDFESEPLDAMFRLRHEVLVETLGWTGLKSIAERELDQFDTPETIYLLSFDPDGRTVRGCVRFTPSLYPTLSSDVFPDVFDDGPPVGPAIYDVSRIVVDPAAQKPGFPNPVAAELFAGWIEAGVVIGLECFTAVVSLAQITKRVSRGWKMIPIGLPREADGEDIVGIRVPTTHEMLSIARRTEGISRNVINPDDRATLRQNHQRLRSLWAPGSEPAGRAIHGSGESHAAAAS